MRRHASNLSPCRLAWLVFFLSHAAIHSGYASKPTHDTSRRSKAKLQNAAPKAEAKINATTATSSVNAAMLNQPAKKNHRLTGRIFLKNPEDSLKFFPTTSQQSPGKNAFAIFEASLAEGPQGIELTTRYKNLQAPHEVFMEDKTVMATTAGNAAAEAENAESPRPLKLMKYEFHQNQSREDALVTHQGSELKFELKKWNPKSNTIETSEDSESFKSHTFSFSQLEAVIREQWPSLIKGDDFDFRVIIPSRLETVGLQLEYASENKDRIRFKLKPSSFVIAMFVSSIFIEFSATEPHVVKRIEGRFPIKSFDDDGDYSDIEGVLEFD